MSKAQDGLCLNVVKLHLCILLIQHIDFKHKHVFQAAISFMDVFGAGFGDFLPSGAAFCSVLVSIWAYIFLESHGFAQVCQWLSNWLGAWTG